MVRPSEPTKGYGVMNTRLVVPVLAGLMTLSTSAFASTGDGPIEQHHRHAQQLAAQEIMPYEHCMALQEQFDAAVKTSGTTAKMQDASKLRADAHKMCGGNQQTAGIKMMEQALADIGVTPMQ